MSATTKSRRFQFTLRTAMILVTLLAAWLGYVTYGVHEQRMAVARIHELGGSIQYDYEIGMYARSSPAGWEWLRRLAGDEYFQDVVFVKLDQTQVSDDDLRIIGKLRRIKTLSLNGTSVSDEGLASIRGLELDYLGLIGTKVTSAGIRRLRPPRKGSIVMLADSSAGDEALPNLAGCVHLALDGTPITSQGLQHLSGFKILRRLSLQRTAVDDEAVPFLSQLTSLVWLNLTDTKMSGEGLFALRNALPKCQIIGDWEDLSRFGALNPRTIQRIAEKGNPTMEGNTTKPISAGVARFPVLERRSIIPTPRQQRPAKLLEHADNLEALDLRGSRVTDEGVRKLQGTSPGLKIYR